MRKKIIISAALLLMVILGIFIYLFSTPLWEKPQYVSVKENMVWVNGKLQNFEHVPVQSKDKKFIDLYSIQKFLGEDLVWDGQNQWVILFKNDNIYRIKCDESVFQKNREEKEPFTDFAIMGKVPYLSVSFLEDFFNIHIYDSEVSGYWRLEEEKYYQSTWTAKKALRIRAEKSIWSKVVDQAAPGDVFLIYTQDHQDEKAPWYYVMTQNNLRGYVQREDIEKQKAYRLVESKAKEEIPRGKRLNMTWEAVYNVPAKYEEIEPIKGLDIIIPTWFELKDKRGNYKQKADEGYVNWAHQQGYEVWGLYSNSFDPKMTKELLLNAKSRENAINQMVDYALQYRLQGINIDYENVYEENKQDLVQFIKELYPIAKQNQLILSMDVTIRGGSANWSRCYDRESLAKHLDYMILMAYDEFWSSSPVAGSVASLPWVEKGIQGLLEQVPAEKLVLGVPFYTRRWEHYKQNGVDKVRSKALSSKYVQELLKEDVKVKIDEKAKQHYLDFEQNKRRVEIWIEDDYSMKQRVDLVKKYDLAGIASWRRGFEIPSFWDIIAQGLKE